MSVIVLLTNLAGICIVLAVLAAVAAFCHCSLRLFKPDLALAQYLLVIVTCISIGLFEKPSFAQDPATNDIEYSVKAPLASQSLLLDSAAVDGQIVAVGERGHILVLRGSPDTWIQSDVPTQATLTGVYFVNHMLGWAVGHDAVILRTEDGGRTWERVHGAPEEEAPLLDVWFKDKNNGFAVGAYGLFLMTTDGGRTWSRGALNILPQGTKSTSNKNGSHSGADRNDYDNFSDVYDFHLNSIARAKNGRLYIAAEGGNIYRSDDDGERWVHLPSPYHGSFFCVLPLEGDTLLVFGLRGNLYRSQDAGETWQPIETYTQETLTDGVQLNDGTVVIVGLGGIVLVSRDQGGSFTLHQQPDRTGLSAVVQADNSTLVAAGEAGVRTLDLASSLSASDQ